MSQRQWGDMGILAHICEQRRLSLQSYGRPRMAEERQELLVKVGHQRVGRLMGENGTKIIRTQKYQPTTDSDHRFNTAPNLLETDFSADLAIRALDMAVALRQPPKDCSHHTDRELQYCSNECQKRLNKHSFKVSMNGKGNCYDCEYGIAA